MIERYQNHDIAGIFSDSHRYKLWREIELALVTAQEAAGVVPKGTASPLSQLPLPNPEQVAEYEKRTHHDVVAFLAALRDLGAADRIDTTYLHYGVTSSDIVDTGLAMQIHNAHWFMADGLNRSHTRLIEAASRSGTVERIGRTHGQWAIPTTLGHQLRVFSTALGRQKNRLAAAVGTIGGKMSGPVGDYSHPGLSPEIERDTLTELGVGVYGPWLVNTQVVSRDSIAHWAACWVNVIGVCEQVALWYRLGAQSEIGEFHLPVPDGAVGSSSMPYKSNPAGAEKVSGLARVARGYLPALFEDVALWGERDISHSSVERIVIPDLCHIVMNVLTTIDQTIANMAVDQKALQRNLGAARAQAPASQTRPGQYRPDGSAPGKA